MKKAGRKKAVSPFEATWPRSCLVSSKLVSRKK